MFGGLMLDVEDGVISDVLEVLEPAAAALFSAPAKPFLVLAAATTTVVVVVARMLINVT